MAGLLLLICVIFQHSVGDVHVGMFFSFLNPGAQWKPSVTSVPVFFSLVVPAPDV